MAEAAVLGALALDLALGWPGWLYARIGHPVGGFARVIGACARAWNRAGWSAARRRLLGVATVLVLLVLAIGGAGPCRRWLCGWLGHGRGPCWRCWPGRGWRCAACTIMCSRWGWPWRGAIWRRRGRRWA
jgi:hypothetical protein